MKRGEIVPAPCEVCGSSEVEMHHEDYARPLEVNMLCKAHHEEADQMKRVNETSGSVGVGLRHDTATALHRQTSRALDFAELGQTTRISRGEVAGSPRLIAVLLPWGRYQNLVAAAARRPATELTVVDTGEAASQ